MLREKGCDHYILSPLIMPGGSSPRTTYYGPRLGYIEDTIHGCPMPTSRPRPRPSQDGDA